MSGHVATCEAICALFEGSATIQAGDGDGRRGQGGSPRRRRLGGGDGWCLGHGHLAADAPFRSMDILRSACTDGIFGKHTAGLTLSSGIP